MDLDMINYQQFKENIRQLLLKHNVAGMAVAVTDGERMLFDEGFGVDP